MVTSQGPVVRCCESSRNGGVREGVREAEGRRAGSAEEELGRIRVQGSCVSYGGEKNHPLFSLTALSLHRDSRICGLGGLEESEDLGARLERVLLGGNTGVRAGRRWSQRPTHSGSPAYQKGPVSV